MERYEIDDLKLIYRVLHRRLTEQVELLDSEFFEDLQRYLQKSAVAEGVDVGDHGAWDAWLGNEAVSCAVRVKRRRTL